MKEKEAYVDFEPQQLIMYVEKEDGTFGPIQTGSYISKNYLDDFWEKTIKLRNSLLEKLKKNEITAIYFYKTIHDFNDVELSRRTKIPVRKVKQHQKVDRFKTAKLADLQKYAYAFDIPVSNLLQAIVVEDNEKKADSDKSKQPIIVKQTRTENPFVVITKIELNK
ncbi:MAG: hypothetical protein C0597_16565 [Marinilabiliales bacterium]|nr:MAG: hypothetical protein C0597_16565 [Marinilabiliales bacterium]